MKTNQQNTENPYPEIFRRAAVRQHLFPFTGCCFALRSAGTHQTNFFISRDKFEYLYKNGRYNHCVYWVKNQYHRKTTNIGLPFGADRSLTDFRIFLLLFAAEFYTDETQQK